MTASIEDLRSQYLFALCNLCGFKTNDNPKLKDFFQLVLEVDKYIEDQKAAANG